jgi:glycosyltransferase involved in cell wall biosynthesis
MKTILISAYAINPFKGSEDGMGWNFVLQAARHQRVIAVTRRNNRPHIERYLVEHPVAQADNIMFLYFDLPAWTRFWKKGPTLSLIYFYLWQISLPFFLFRYRKQVDIVHNLNFHNDWTPTFLWLLRKPMVWGPVGHHPRIPKQFLLPVYGRKAWLADRTRWAIKQFFWKLDPFLRISVRKADLILTMNSEARTFLRFPAEKEFRCSSVASEAVAWSNKTSGPGLKVLSVGRFVPLKGFDVTLRSFARFYHDLPEASREQASLTLVGDGPLRESLERMALELGIGDVTTFIPWIQRTELADLYRASDVFLFPSHEGAGMVVSEAMSYGLPVICFRNSGPGEFVSLASGFRVPYDDYGTCIVRFATHLRELHDDPALRSRMSGYARMAFEERFEWSNKGEALKNAYGRLEQQQRILAVQLMNDYSGSPLVLANAIRGFVRDGRKVELFISSSTKDGFLSGLPVKTHTFWYRFYPNKWKRLLALATSQAHLFLRILFKARKNDVVYINTLLPFGAALAAKLRGARVITHLHETSIQPQSLKSFLRFVVEHTASRVVHVSYFLREQESFRKPDQMVVYNATSEVFVRTGGLHRYEAGDQQPFTVLMLCSLKAYKGVFEYAELARQLPDLRFELVLNATEAEIISFFKPHVLPANLHVHPCQRDVHPFYRRAQLVLNLSHPDQWIETFGMTILESMSYGIPEIVPDIGGPKELVDHGINGFRINVNELDRIAATIRFLEQNRGECLKLSVKARSKAEQFTIGKMQAELCKAVTWSN